MGDAGIAVDQGEGDRDADPGGQPDPDISRDVTGGGGGEGGPEHLAFEADVDDAGAFREQAGQRRQH